MDFTRSSLKLFASNVTRTTIEFVGIAIFARALGASEMGMFFLFQALLGMIAIPADFGFRGAIEKRISEGREQGTYLASAFAVKLVPMALVVTAILVFQDAINGYIGAEFALLLALALVVQDISTMSTVVLRGELRVGETAILRVARWVVWFAVGTLLVSQGFGVEALIYGLLAGLGVMLVWGWYRVSIPLGRVSLEHAKSLFEYGRWGVISRVGWYFYSWMDVAVIGFFLTQADVGAYEIAWRVTLVVMLLSRSIATTLFPQASRWDAEDAYARIEDMIRKTITPSMALVIPSFFVTLVYAREILGLIFGQEYTVAWLVLIVLMGEKLLQSVHTILGRSLQALDRPDLAAAATVASIIVNLVLNVVLILEFGIVGAAVATAASFVLNTVLHAHFLSTFVTIDFPWTEVGWCTGAAAAMAGILYGIGEVVAIDTLPRLLGILVVGAVIYALFTMANASLRRKFVGEMQSLARSMAG
ncbi:MAG: flippase [Halococcoides sp.]